MHIAPARPVWRLALLVALISSGLSTAHAALTINTTRIVHDSQNRNTSVVVANPSKRTYAVQTWVNTEADDTVTAVPLLATPALFRLDPDAEQLVQISALPNDLPQDRESLFYFNVQEIPQVSESGGNQLNIALRTRIKVFYRPSQLKASPQELLKQLTFSVQSVDGTPHLVVDNPTPYHYTFSRLELSSGAASEKIQAVKMAPPMGRQAYALTQMRANGDLQVTFTTLNDYGAVTPVMTSPVHALKAP